MERLKPAGAKSGRIVGSRHIEEIPKGTTTGRVAGAKPPEANPPRSDRREYPGYDPHINYEPKQHHVVALDERMTLTYRKKQLSDGEARRYFIGKIQVAYARVFDKAADPAWLVCCIGSDPQHGQMCRTEKGIMEFLFRELMG